MISSMSRFRRAAGKRFWSPKGYPDFGFWITLCVVGLAAFAYAAGFFGGSSVEAAAPVLGYPPGMDNPKSKIQNPKSAVLPTSMVISQIYGGGGNTGAPWQNDFIELFNPTTDAISLTGWSVQYAA